VSSVPSDRSVGPFVTEARGSTIVAAERPRRHGRTDFPRDPVDPPTEGADHRDRWVSIRPIELTDAAGLSDFYARTSPESRRRFLSCSRLSEAALGRRFTHPGGEGFLAVVDEAGPNDGAIVAHAAPARGWRMIGAIQI
jgi:hypothetical protein